MGKYKLSVRAYEGVEKAFFPHFLGVVFKFLFLNNSITFVAFINLKFKNNPTSLRLYFYSIYLFVVKVKIEVTFKCYSCVGN